MNDHLSLEYAFLGVNLLSREGKSQTGLTARPSRPDQRIVAVNLFKVWLLRLAVNCVLIFFL